MVGSVVVVVGSVVVVEDDPPAGIIGTVSGAPPELELEFVLLNGMVGRPSPADAGVEAAVFLVPALPERSEVTGARTLLRVEVSELAPPLVGSTVESRLEPPPVDGVDSELTRLVRDPESWDTSVVMGCTYRGTALSFCREHRTTVPVHMHRVGHWESGPQSL